MLPPTFFALAAPILVLDSVPLQQPGISTTVEKLWILKEIAAPTPSMNIWKQVLSRIEQVVDRTEYDTWFAPTRFLSQKGDTVDVGVPSQRYVDEIRERFGAQIRGLLNEISPERVQVHFVVDTSRTGDDLPIPIAPAAGRAAPGHLQPALPLRHLRRRQLQPARLRRLASPSPRTPAARFNPLFLYGGVGLGKTHLIQAIGQQIREQRPAAEGRLHVGRQFVNELITSIRYDRMQALPRALPHRRRAAARRHPVPRRQGAHAGRVLPHLQRALRSAEADHPHLRSRRRKTSRRSRSGCARRFEWGLIADIQPPDLETKVAILRKKAEEKKIDLPDDVALFIAERVRSNIRELEGQLNRVAAFSSLDRQAAVTRARQGNAEGHPRRRTNKPITAAEIIKVVAAHYGLKVVRDQERRPTRSTIAFPRQVAMYMCKELTDLSYPEIGKQFNDKHHSTVMYSVEKIEKMIDGRSAVRANRGDAGETVPMKFVGAVPLQETLVRLRKAAENVLKMRSVLPNREARSTCGKRHDFSFVFPQRTHRLKGDDCYTFEAFASSPRRISARTYYYHYKRTKTWFEGRDTWS